MMNRLGIKRRKLLPSFDRERLIRKILTNLNCTRSLVCSDLNVLDHRV